ncbi:hypothetical protein E4K67_22555 [Desulfosporosinus fructosivorans]|uniref:Uncharacterized protein n=2 Tax=Desulfosporosinus fructosivorans TaxID=2018669 RepID=A0A4Z0QYM2_9FIRM|nr:hypothetical protein E4K67_22555 [Desulfosporosinus fructosivorans]
MQDKPKFTPGPWELEETEDGHIIRMGKAIENHSEFPSHLEIDYDHGCLFDGDEGDVFNEVEIRQAKEAYANANLISAAPDMYEALQRALTFITNGIENGYIQMPDLDSGDSALETPNIIKQALTKAQGGGST